MEQGDHIFQERLRAARAMRGLSQGELAARAELPPSSVGHFESGGRKPAYESLHQLAVALEVTVDYLMGLSESPVPVRGEDRVGAAYDRLESPQRDIALVMIEALGDPALLADILRLIEDRRARGQDVRRGGDIHHGL